jgi:hypothetical protein
LTGGLFAPAIGTWNSYGVPYVHAVPSWANVTFHCEAWMRAAAGTVHYRYYNETDSAAVAGSDLSTTSATMVLQRTGSLTLLPGKTYRHQFARSVGGAGEKQYAMLLGVPI